MSTRFSGAYHLSEDKCSFCGKRQYDGAWCGNEFVLACSVCARKVLPVLYAGATWSKFWNPGQGTQDLISFQAQFWKAQAINASRCAGTTDLMRRRTRMAGNLALATAETDRPEICTDNDPSRNPRLRCVYATIKQNAPDTAKKIARLRDHGGFGNLDITWHPAPTDKERLLCEHVWRLAGGGETVTHSIQIAPGVRVI